MAKKILMVCTSAGEMGGVSSLIYHCHVFFHFSSSFFISLPRLSSFSLSLSISFHLLSHFVFFFPLLFFCFYPLTPHHQCRRTQLFTMGVLFSFLNLQPRIYVTIRILDIGKRVLAQIGANIISSCHSLWQSGGTRCPTLV